MNPISSAELASIRADIQAAAMDQTCQIQRKTTTDDGLGSASEIWVTITTTVCGMTQPGAGLLENYGYKIGSLATWVVELPYGTNVQELDHIIVDGQTLEVQVLLDPRSYAGCVMVLASEIK
jgi:hypothetical protein